WLRASRATTWRKPSSWASSTIHSRRSGPAPPRPPPRTSWRACARGCERGWSATRRPRPGRPDPRPVMERRRLGRTDMDVSVLGFGGSEIGYERAGPRTVARLLGGALDAGLNGIDTAPGHPGRRIANG